MIHMANVRNYAKELDKIMDCAAPGEQAPDAAAACLLRAVFKRCARNGLTAAFDVTVLFYNPNIAPEAEYEKRAAELARLIREMPAAQGVQMVCAPYDAKEFLDAVRGLEQVPRGRRALLRLLPPASRGGRPAMRRRTASIISRRRSLDQPAEECRKAQRDRRGACRAVRRGAPAGRL